MLESEKHPFDTILLTLITIVHCRSRHKLLLQFSLFRSIFQFLIDASGHISKVALSDGQCKAGVEQAG